jgi:hypothetical protein
LSRHTRLAHEKRADEDSTTATSAGTTDHSNNIPPPLNHVASSISIGHLNTECGHGDGNSTINTLDQGNQYDVNLQQIGQFSSNPINSATDLVPSVEHASMSHQSWLSGREINHEEAAGTTANQFELNSGAGPTEQVDEIPFNTDLDILWSDFDTYSNLMLPTSYATDYPMNFLPLARYGIFESPDTHNENTADEGETPVEDGALSRYASRLPSVQPQPEHNRMNPNESGDYSLHGEASRICPSPRRNQPWRISREDYQLILTSLKSYSTLLPSDFEFPSRHALCRYTEGYFSGFHEHLPFMHLSTVSMVTIAPELILAIAAVGAQYRFQRTESYRLYDAARALVEQQIRRRDGYGAPPSVLSDPSMLSDGNLRYHSTRGDVSAAYLTTTSAQLGADSNNESAETIFTMQAMILLIALGTWNHRSLLKDALSMASQLAMLVHEYGISTKHERPTDITFDDWVCSEGRLRTSLVAYAFLNLHSIAYNIAPKLMNSEIRLLQLPSPESHWRASDQSEWLAARHREPYSEVTVNESYNRLLTDDAHRRNQKYAPSSFGNYILIHGIIQQIFFARQSNLDLGRRQSNALPLETMTRLQSALRHWQHNWEAAKDSSIDPSAPGGPLSFNSTALFRVAYIRIHADLGPCRQLESRDPVRIANALHDSPLLARSPDVCRAVLQCAHSLSIPVRIGIEFVARTQSLNWSIVHSLCNLECAFFLSKWLESVAALVAAEEELREDEKKLLAIVKSILSETSLKHSFNKDEWDSRTIQRMSAAVVRLWGETFRGAHVFEIMGVIGAALGIYADYLDRELST